MACRFGDRQHCAAARIPPHSSEMDTGQTRDKRDAAKSRLADGIGPSIAEKEAGAAVTGQSNTLARVAPQRLEVHQTRVGKTRQNHLTT